LNSKDEAPLIPSRHSLYLGNKSIADYISLYAIVLKIELQLHPMVNGRQSTPKPFLSVIVPVHNMEGNLHFLKSWLNLEILDQMRVILVHDKEIASLTIL
jgi:hypothetical protein